MAKKETKYARHLVYTGRRKYENGKTLQRFEILPKREEVFFSGVKGVYLGYTYGASIKQLARRPERLDEYEREDNPAWDAADALVDVANAKKRADSVLSRLEKPALKAAIDALTPLVASLDYYDTKELVTYIASKIKRVKRGKTNFDLLVKKALARK